MAKLYSNPNAFRRTLNLGRVTNQQLQKVQRLTTPSAEAVAAEEILCAAQAAGEKRQAEHVLRELVRVMRVMEARTDKRRRPEGVSTEAFNLYRKLKLKHPPAKKKKNHPAKPKK